MHTKRIVSSLFSLAVLGVGGFCIWKYVLDKPENLDEVGEAVGDFELGDLSDAASEAAGDLFDAAGDLSDRVGETWETYGPGWDFSEFTDALSDLSDAAFGKLFDEEPQLGDNTTLTWKDKHVDSNNGGLTLTLLNALDDTWQSEFDIAVANWQESDALVLETQRVAVDNTCQRVEGVMVVCNANFGATGWVGINENSLTGNKITSSVSKMNEHYLNNADFDHRRYTMCHELGHGFGLPHTDENPYNDNMGDCLDYTDDPEENMLPGDVNMDKLRNMYLTTRKRRVQEDGTIVETTHLIKR